MCRLVAYLGYDLLLADVLVKPEDSLIKQSLLARESSIPTNGDGFGVGWYVPQISPNPAVFLSILPAWNDENLLHLAEKIKSSAFFGHVRAASSGGVNTYNCHPFIYKQWMFMHNGEIENFITIKRHIIQLLDDDIYNWIRGRTDSEHFFALFLQLAKNKNPQDLLSTAAVLQQTFAKIEQLLDAAGSKGISYYNICLTDGKRMIASRYCTDKKTEPESLHYLENGFFWSEEDYIKENNLTNNQCVLIASEQLTDFSDQWRTVPANHLLLVGEDYQVTLQKIHS